MKANMMGKISFYLALSPWIFAVVQMLGLPGFG
jgi:hypothetical protein